MLLEFMDLVGLELVGLKLKFRLFFRLSFCWRILCMLFFDLKKSGFISFSDELELFFEIIGCVERIDWVEIILGEFVNVCCRDVMVFLIFCWVEIKLLFSSLVRLIICLGTGYRLVKFEFCEEEVVNGI